MKQTWQNYSLLLQNINKATRKFFFIETLPEKIEGKKTSCDILGLQKLEYTSLFPKQFWSKIHCGFIWIKKIGVNAHGQTFLSLSRTLLADYFICTRTDFPSLFKRRLLFVLFCLLAKLGSWMHRYDTLQTIHNVLVNVISDLWNPKSNNNLKSPNLQYNTLVRWLARTNDSSTKHLMFQVMSFFIISFKIISKNHFNYFSYFSINLQK